MAHYMCDAGHRALVTTIANLAPCQMAGRVTEDQVAIVLGEVGDVWPIAIVADADHDADAIIVSAEAMASHGPNVPTESYRNPTNRVLCACPPETRTEG